jgi:electron transport complex protein RnfC
VYRAVTRGEPVVSRYVTVAGEVPRPRNLQVLLGTPVRDCLNTCGYEEDPGRRIILGGPMMGMHVRNPGIPVTKITNCILVQKEVPAPPEMPCIRCGDCVGVCPVKLLPQQLYWFARSDNLEAVQRHHLFDCIECGCCAYVCPSNIPLVQYYRHAKSRIAAEERRREGADRARSRFMARNNRLAEEKERSRAEPGAGDLVDKRAYIDAAVERVRARRDAAGVPPETDGDKGG